jgi:putative flavoprotein involved in K+ transport
VQWWLLASGILDECIDDVDDPVRVRRLPSPQLVGTPERMTLDLNALTARGVRLAGRLAGVRNGKAQFSGSLRNHCALADLKMRRLLRTFDDWAADHLDKNSVGSAEEFAATRIDSTVPLGLDFNSGEIRSIVWATGYRADYSWLDVPVIDRKGHLRHDGGVVAAPGIYALGLPFLRRRKSSFIHGAEDDVRDLSSHIASYLDRHARPHVKSIAV